LEYHCCPPKIENAMKKDKVVLWDLGNVVVRWSPETILLKLDYPLQETAFLRESLFRHSDWLDLDRGTKTEREVANRLTAESGLSMEKALRCFEVVRETLVDIEQSVALINEIADAGLPMYVLSNMSLPNAEYLRQRAYFQRFEGVVISAEEKLIKPDEALFNRVLARYSLLAESILFIDDTLENIQTARQLGMQTVHFGRTDKCYAKIREFADI